VTGVWREASGRHKDGHTFPIYLAECEMMLGKQRYSTCIVHDITERKRAERGLIAAKEQAELANRTKDSFLATMSHEIRTPLTGLMGMLELLSTMRLEREQVETLDTARSSAGALLRIVNDILDWSKIQEGELQLLPQATSVPRLLKEVVSTYSHIASAKKLVL
jgi:signal transduction histidine kinase